MAMNRQISLASLFAVAMLCGTAFAGGYDIYLLIGQSNMSGRGTLTADNAVSNDRIVKFTKDMKWVPADEPLHFDRKPCGAGLAMSFARRMADASPERTIALVPCAVGGTPLRQWCPGGDLYSNAVVRARAAFRDGSLKGILWHQGCADANNITNAETYAARLVPMVAQLRKDLGAETIVYEWAAPQRISGARIVFDSVMKGTTKRMMKLEADETRVKMPAPLAKAFRIEARVGGEWKAVYEDDLNILRLRKVVFDPIDADALRFVVTETWGGARLTSLRSTRDSGGGEGRGNLQGLSPCAVTV